MSDDISFGGLLRTPAGQRLRFKNSSRDEVYRSAAFLNAPTHSGRWLWFLDGEMLGSDEYTFRGSTVTLTKVAIYPGQTLDGVYLGHDENHISPPARINKVTVQKEVVNVTRGQTAIALTKDVPLDVRRVDVFVGGLYQHLGTFDIETSKRIVLGSGVPMTGEVMVVAYLTPFDLDPNAF